MDILGNKILIYNVLIKSEDIKCKYNITDYEYEKCENIDKPPDTLEPKDQIEYDVILKKTEIEKYKKYTIRIHYIIGHYIRILDNINKKYTDEGHLGKDNYIIKLLTIYILGRINIEYSGDGVSRERKTDKEKKGLVETLKNILIQKPPFGNPINIEEYINKINSNSEKEHVRRIIGLRKDEVTFQENEPKKIILHIINNTREMVIRSLSKYFMGPGYIYDYIDDISPILIYYQHIVINEVQVQEEVKNKLKYIPDLHKVFICRIKSLFERIHNNKVKVKSNDKSIPVDFKNLNLTLEEVGNGGYNISGRNIKDNSVLQGQVQSGADSTSIKRKEIRLSHDTKGGFVEIFTSIKLDTINFVNNEIIDDFYEQLKEKKENGNTLVSDLNIYLERLSEGERNSPEMEQVVHLNNKFYLFHLKQLQYFFY